MRDSLPLLASALALALSPSLLSQQGWLNAWNSAGNAAGDSYGYSVSGMPDLDGDGFTEVLVGAIGADNGGRNSGSVYLIDGDTGQILLQVDGEGAGDLLGVSVLGLEDVNADGTPDFAAGAPYYYGSNGFFSGRVYLFSGANGDVLATVDGLVAGEMLGSALEAADLDNDGVREILISAIGANGMDGEVRAYNFTNNALVENPAYLMAGQAGLESWFGYSLDAQGDPLAMAPGEEVAVGAPFLGNGGGAEVWATVPGVGFSSARTFQHSGVGNGAGISVSILPGALGTIYLAAGAPLSGTGSAIVWNVATQAELHEIIGSNSNTHFGFSVGLLDDVNFDGEPDLAIGEPGASHVEVIDLQSPTLDSLLTIDGTSGDRMGWSLAPVGDSNGTLTGDLVVAASRMNAGAGSRQGGIAHWSPPDTNLDPPTISVNSSYMQGETVDITVSNLREACDVYFYAGTNQNPTTSAEGFDLDIGGFLFGTTGDYFHLASSVTGGTANHQITIPPTVAPGTPLIFQVATERAGFVRVSDIDGGVVVAHPFELVLDTPPTAGQTLQMHCDYGHPNSVIYWFYGTALGNSGALGGTISDTGLNNPQSIGTTTANSSGTSNQTFDVPPPAQGHTVYFSVVSWALNDELLDVSDPQVVL